METNYTPQTPTKVQLCCNAIRDMFFHKHYKGIVPAKDLLIVRNGEQWHRRFTKKAVRQAIKELIEEEYINLDEAGENWKWGLPGTHEMLFGD
ncbi:MAG TPA: hypothetical protein VLB82_09965 [Thermodesulfobacteriota bacterium]|nr:hypothetical protein [Thermodesulfobacteriota bacterium]